MRKTIINIIRKITTSAMLFAFLFNANFITVSTVFAEYDDLGYTDYTVGDSYFDNNVTYTNWSNPNVDYVTYGCEYYGTCSNSNTNTNDLGYTGYTTGYSNQDNNVTYTNWSNPNVDYVTYGCENCDNNVQAYVPVTQTPQAYNPVVSYLPQPDTNWYNPVTQASYVQPVTYVAPTTIWDTVTNWTNPTYTPQAPTIWGGSNNYTQTYNPVVYTNNGNTNTYIDNSNCNGTNNCNTTTNTNTVINNGTSYIPPVISLYCALNGATYNSQNDFSNYCKLPTLSLYCTINGQTYNSQSAYDQNCRNITNLYCSLNGQTYTSQQSYADGCRKYCSVNGYYYATQNEFDSYCRNSTQNFYCSLNNQTYTNVSDYNNYCKNNSTQNYYCSVNGQTYYNVSDYNNYCRSVNNNSTWYCALNGSTYYSQDNYNSGCKIYCSYNSYYYNSQSDFNNYCKTIIVNTHRVVTTIPTQIAQTSARCNGVGMITNNVNTNGYFEYGTTQSLGYTTNSGFIGNQMSTQYSNMITGLKPNTIYYCRAVIVNANGTYKGELMSFRTVSEYVKYIPAIVTPKKVVTYVKNKTITKIDKGGMDITCQDVDGNKDIIKAGDKLATIKIENVNDKITKGSVVNYKVTYKNTSELTLSNVIVKITAPKDMTFTDKNIGEYDAIENSITLEDARVRTDETVEKIISLKINDEVVVGKSLIVNSYLSYEILDTKGETLKDEVTNYVISTVTSVDTAVDSDTKDGADNKNTNSVMPNTLLEWVAVVVLIMLLFILARFIINDVKSIKGGNSHDDNGHGNNVSH